MKLIPVLSVLMIAAAGCDGAHKPNDPASSGDTRYTSDGFALATSVSGYSLHAESEYASGVPQTGAKDEFEEADRGNVLILQYRTSGSPVSGGVAKLERDGTGEDTIPESCVGQAACPEAGIYNPNPIRGSVAIRIPATGSLKKFKVRGASDAAGLAIKNAAKSSAGGGGSSGGGSSGGGSSGGGSSGGGSSGGGSSGGGQQEEPPEQTPASITLTRSSGTSSNVYGSSIEIAVSHANFSSEPVIICNLPAGLSLSGDKTLISGEILSSATVSCSASKLTQSASSNEISLSMEPKSITVIVVVDSKPYDGTDTAVISSCEPVGVRAGDNVICSPTHGTFSSVSIGNHQATAHGLSLSGPDASKYSIPSTAQNSASIVPRQLSASVSLSVKSKLYDGSASLAGDQSPSLNVSGVLPGDQNPLSMTCAYNSSSVGSGKSIVCSFSSSDANYSAPANETIADAIITAPPAPTVTNVTSSATGYYTAGPLLDVMVSFSAPVDVTGTPILALANMPQGTMTASYHSGSGTSTLTFLVTIPEGFNTTDLDAAPSSPLANVSGSTIKDVHGTDAVLALPAPGTPGSLGANKNIVIDTILPTVSDLYVYQSINDVGSTLRPSIRGLVSEISDVAIYSDAACTSRKSFLWSSTVLASPGIILSSDVQSNARTELYVRASDQAGNQSACVSLPSGYTHDDISPSVSSFTAKSGQSLNVEAAPVEFTLTLSEAIYEPSLTSADISNAGTATGVTWTITSLGSNQYNVKATASEEGTLSPSLSYAAFSDLAGNVNQSTVQASDTVTVSSQPKVLKVEAQVPDSDYAPATENVYIHVYFDKNVQASGAPGGSSALTIQMANGGQATFIGVLNSDHKQVQFQYLPPVDASLGVIDYASAGALAGADLYQEGSASIKANLTLPAPGSASSLSASNNSLVRRVYNESYQTSPISYNGTDMLWLSFDRITAPVWFNMCPSGKDYLIKSVTLYSSDMQSPVWQGSISFEIVDMSDWNNVYQPSSGTSSYSSMNAWVFPSGTRFQTNLMAPSSPASDGFFLRIGTLPTVPSGQGLQAYQLPPWMWGMPSSQPTTVPYDYAASQAIFFDWGMTYSYVQADLRYSLDIGCAP